MGAESPVARVAKGPMRFGPGSVGLAVLLVAVVLVLFVASDRRIAVGFVVPILAAAVADAVLGARTIEARRVRIGPVRTVVAAPDQITFQVVSEPGAGPARVLVGPMQANEPIIPVALPADQPAVTVTWPTGTPHVAYYVRHLTESTRFGLIVARRYTVTEIAAGAWRIGPPVGLTLGSPPLSDELTRLRQYVPGDRLSRVSWPTTARTGQLHVRSEEIDPTELVVVVDCGTTEAEAETALRFAAGVITRQIESGVTVRLITRTYAVYYRAVADRMLADPTRSPAKVVEEVSAAAGAADTVADGWVTTSDEMIRRLAVAEFGPPLPSPGVGHVRIDASGASVVP